MLKDFDLAFTNKIKAWFSNTIYANTAIVYNIAYNLVDDPTTELRFPLISIYRPSGFEINAAQNFAARKQGIDYLYNETDDSVVKARFLSVKLPYQIDIYAKSPEDLDDITEDIIHALNLDSVLEVEQVDLGSNESYIERYDIVHNNGPVEQSEFQNGDRVYHYSLAYDLPNARLLNFRKTKAITSTDISTSAGEEDV